MNWGIALDIAMPAATMIGLSLAYKWYRHPVLMFLVGFATCWLLQMLLSNVVHGASAPNFWKQSPSCSSTVSAARPECLGFVVDQMDQSAKKPPPKLEVDPKVWVLAPPCRYVLENQGTKTYLRCEAP